MLNAQIGADLEQVRRAQEQIGRRLGAIDRTLRKLIDNLTEANREHVDRRLAELATERAGLEEERESLRRLVLSHEQAGEIIKRLENELDALPHLLRCNAQADRRAALRRCVEHVRFNADTRMAVVTVFHLPRIAEGPTSPETTDLEIRLPQPANGRTGTSDRKRTRSKRSG